MYGFSFNGMHSNTYGIIMRSRNRQALPAVNDRYMQIPGRHGSYYFPGEMGDRIIEIECVLVENSLENLREKMHQIAGWLYAEERKQLAFDDEPGKYYLAKLEDEVDLEQEMRLGRFELLFRCDPFAYGTEQQANFVNDAVTLNNPGTFEALPAFSATFMATAAEWKVTLGSKYVRVVHNFQAGDTLEVNCATGAVLINGARAVADLDWQNSEFITLAPGESTLTITPAGVSDTTVTFTPRWL